MEENINIPYDKLEGECRTIDAQGVKNAAAAVSALSARYSKEELVKVYNYLFEHSECYEVLAAVLEKMDKIKSASSLPVLIDALLMKNKMASRISDNAHLTRLRINIIRVLANTKDSQAVHPLLYCLNDKNENYRVKLSCADALGRIGDKYAVLPLMSILEDENEHSIYVKESAVSALGMLGDDKAADSLVSILEMKNGFIDKFTFLKERALEALNKLKFKGSRVIRALEKSLQDESPRVRINAIEVLMNSNDERAPELIKRMLFDKDLEVVKNAVTALYNLFDTEVLEEIINSGNMPDSAKTAAVNLKDELIAGDNGNVL